MEENNRMEKTRDVFKKIRDTKSTFHAKMGSIKDRTGMDQTEAEDIRRGGKNTRTVQKRPSRPRYYEGVIDHSPRARHSGM